MSQGDAVFDANLSRCALLTLKQLAFIDRN